MHMLGKVNVSPEVGEKEVSGELQPATQMSATIIVISYIHCYFWEGVKKFPVISYPLPLQLFKK